VRLVLFDIHGTRLPARGAGRRALRRALERLYGTSGAIDGYDVCFFDSLAAADGAADDRLREEARPQRDFHHVQAGGRDRLREEARPHRGLLHVQA